jgi:cyclic pyranopterin phosphate synthase
MHGRFFMNDVGEKPITRRSALATGRIRLGPDAYPRVAERTLPKGDALTLAEVAGVLGAKRTSDLLPLCHPLGLDHVALAFELDPAAQAVVAYCEASTQGRTGVEMEALTGVQVALLTIWDLAKPIDSALAIDGVRLLRKVGGKSGRWLHPEGLPTLPGRFAERDEGRDA